MFGFIAKVLSDDSGRPSSNRVCLLLITLFVLAALAAAQYKAEKWGIPAVTDSFVNLIEWLVSALGLGILGPKVGAVVQNIKLGDTDQTVTGIAGPMGPAGPAKTERPAGDL